MYSYFSEKKEKYTFRIIQKCKETMGGGFPKLCKGCNGCPDCTNLSSFNELLRQKYPYFKSILEIKTSSTLTYDEVKLSFKNKIKTANLKTKIDINICFEYLINEVRRRSYNPLNIDEIQYFDNLEECSIIFHNNSLLEKLLESKDMYQLNKKNNGGRTLLYLACKCGYVDTARILLRVGSDANETQVNKSSPLHVSCYYNHYEVVQLLLESGADLTQKNNFGNIAETEANDENMKKMINNFKLDNGYMLFIDNRSCVKNVKLIFSDDKLVGKRCLVNNGNFTDYDWNLSWHGTRMVSISSILKNGLKKTGEFVEGKEIDIRKDTCRIGRDKEFRDKNTWAEAVFTSDSIFYATSIAYAEHYKDFNDICWCVVLECRIKRDTYVSSKHTFNEYKLRMNEEENVENRSENSSNVIVIAFWLVQKNFLATQTDHSILIEFLKGFMMN